jgi:carboxymethylenebutenolidase
MRMLSRRVLLGSIAAFVVPRATYATTPEDLSANNDEGAISLTRYAAGGDGRRPAVLVLHGGRGVELKPLAYERHAKALSAGGIDAYLVRYFTPADQTALDHNTSTPESRDAYCTNRFDGWVRRISSVVTAVLARPESSGHIGLLGFSLGAYVAADTAAHDDRVMALAVMYGGMPDAMVAQVKRMPSLIELHGDADQIVPIAKGKQLVELAKAAGAPAEQIVYPGRGHGFDFSDTDPMTGDAIEHVVSFFQAQLFPT